MSGLQKSVFIIKLIGLQVLSGWAQDTIREPVAAIIKLDSLTVRASRNGFNVEDFIGYIKEDQTFYQAFRNLRSMSYSFRNQIRVTHFQSGQVDYFNGLANQTYIYPCRSMDWVSSDHSDGYYRRKSVPRYFTTELYESIFLTPSPVCIDTISNGPASKKPRGAARYQADIRRIIFSPGQGSDLPIIGRKMNIFTKKMLPYYVYNLSSSHYGNQDVYVFEAVVDSNYVFTQTQKTILKKIITYFSKKDFQVLFREYEMKYQHPLVQFDLTMRVHIANDGRQYYPDIVEYKGYWNIPTKRPEQANFTWKIIDLL